MTRNKTKHLKQNLKLLSEITTCKEDNKQLFFAKCSDRTIVTLCKFLQKIFLEKNSRIGHELKKSLKGLAKQDFCKSAVSVLCSDKYPVRHKRLILSHPQCRDSFYPFLVDQMLPAVIAKLSCTVGECKRESKIKRKNKRKIAKITKKLGGLQFSKGVPEKDLTHITENLEKLDTEKGEAEINVKSDQKK